MEEINLLELIKRRFAALMAGIDPRADPKLVAEVPATLRQTDTDLPAVFMRARRVLEIIVLDIYRRELPTARPKPLADMIEALYEQKGLVSKRVAADLHYIRVNGNLIIHPQDEVVEIRPGDAEPVLLVFLSIVEWYLKVYLPERLGEAPARAPTLPPPSNPYRGLLAFRETDADNYFGREPDAADLLAAIERQPLVAVVGPSGSGKSSLVYAGVVPPLRAADGMRIADFRPRGRPFAALAQALVALWPIDPADRVAQARKLAAHLAEAQATLTDAVQETLRQGGGNRLVLIADQFEEIYTLGQPGDETQGFADLLVQAVQDSLPIPNRAGPPELCLLLTLRADFLGHALAHPGLAALLDRCPPKLLGPVEDRARLRAIIEQPARGAGVALEDLLPERILRDLAQAQFSRQAGTADQVGGASLPLLEFALCQLWDRQQERRLTHRGYEELGGIQQALSRHADGVLARLDPADQARMRHVLVQMVRPGEGTEDTRQVATRDQLSPDDWPLVVRLADADTRLVVTGHDQTTDQDTAELVHEALIRYWSPLREWINEDRAFRLWQNGLRQAMGEWERTGRDDGALLAGARLAEAGERIGSDSGRIGEAEVRYVQASVGRRDAEAAERERSQHERQRLQRRLTLGLASFLSVALILSALFLWQWGIAEDRGGQLAASLGQESAARQAAQTERQRAEAQGQVALEARRRADDELLAANRNLARAHEEKAVAILRRPPDELVMREFQHALLHVLEAQRASIRGQPGLTTFAGFAAAGALFGQAFSQRWASPSPDLGPSLTAIAISPDGKLVAGAARDGVIRVWSRATGERVHALTGHHNWIVALRFSPNSRMLASVSLDQTARLWDLATGDAVRTLGGPADAVTAIEFSPDGHLLITGSADTMLRIWDSSAVATLRILSGHSSRVTGVAFSHDGSIIASSSSDGTVRLWHSATGEPTATLHGDGGPVHTVAFSPGDSLLASVSEDQTIRLWNPATGKIVRTLTGHEGTVLALAFTPDGRLLASADNSHARGGTVRLWNLQTGQAEVMLDHYCKTDVSFLYGRTSLFDFPGLCSETVAFSPDGRVLATMNDNVIAYFDPTTGKALRELTGSKRRIRNLVFSPTSRLIASISSEGTIELLDSDTGRVIRTLAAHDEAVAAIAFAPDGQQLAGALRDGTLQLWQPLTGERLHTLRGHGGRITSVAFSPSGGVVATASEDKTVRLWDDAKEESLRILSKHEAAVATIDFSPDGTMLASASEDGIIIVWRTADGKLLHELVGHDKWIHKVAWSPDGSRLAVASGHSLQFWEPVTGETVRAPIGDGKGRAVSIAFTPDGSLLALAWTGDYGPENQNIELVNPATGKTVRRLQGHIGVITSMAFSPDGRLFASTDSATTLRLWDVNSGKSLSTLTGPYAVTGDKDVTLPPTDSWVDLSRGLFGVRFSADGQQVATTSPSGLQLWEALTRGTALTWRPHLFGAYLPRIATSADGRFVAEAKYINRKICNQ